MKERYQLYIDDALSYESNHVKYLKDRAQFEFDYCNAFYARIMVGKRIYASKKYNENWHRWYYETHTRATKETEVLV